MNRSDFLRLMDGSAGTFDRRMVGEIAEIVSMFPYFHSAHLLLLKGLHDNSDVKFSNQLKTSSIQIASREVLYTLLSHPQSIKEEVAGEAGSMESVEKAQPDSTDQNVQPAPVEHQYDVLPQYDLTAQSDAPVQSASLTQADLIDRFIIANPRIGPIRDKSESPAEDRSEHVHGDGAFISETLAKIYVSQGYYSKAIDIFEKLSLKYPEKSSYFATQIQKIKELLKK